MRLMNLEQLRHLMADRDLQVVVEGSGLSYTACYNMKHGKTENPKLETMTKLTRYFEAQHEQLERIS